MRRLDNTLSLEEARSKTPTAHTRGRGHVPPTGRQTKAYKGPRGGAPGNNGTALPADHRGDRSHPPRHVERRHTSARCTGLRARPYMLAQFAQETVTPLSSARARTSIVRASDAVPTSDYCLLIRRPLHAPCFRPRPEVIATVVGGRPSIVMSRVDRLSTYEPLNEYGARPTKRRHRTGHKTITDQEPSNRSVFGSPGQSGEGR